MERALSLGQFERSNGVKSGDKYGPLRDYLKRSEAVEVAFTFAELEALLGSALPPSAWVRRGWWSNRRSGTPQAAAWMAAGYRVETLDIDQEWVTFRKPGIYEVRRDGDIILWDADLVKALRRHMDLSQTELAQQLGVRQQTISEWERGAYEPRRAMCKYLSIIAEQAGFAYDKDG
jgi:DNA-binding XRE family transcriptional regulator